jgi:hypothetical protein
LRRLIVLAALVAVLALALALPAFASHAEPGVDEPCDVAHECTHHYAKWLPPGHDLASPGVWGWNPNGEYGYQYVLWLAGFCTNQGGYWYEGSDGAAYWNAC